MPGTDTTTDLFYAGEAFIGYGAQFLVGQDDGSPETFVAVPDIMSITPGDMNTGVVDKTHLRSPGRHREKLGTIRDSGPITLAGNSLPSRCHVPVPSVRIRNSSSTCRCGGCGAWPDFTVTASTTKSSVALVPPRK